MTDSKSKIEAQAGRLLSQFDPGMYVDYKWKTHNLISQYKQNPDKLSRIVVKEDELVTGETHPVYYIQFSEPVYVTFSNPLSIFRRKSGRQAGKKGSTHFFFERALVPVYFPSMNTMAMLKLYQERATKVFEASGRFFDEMKCIELSHKTNNFRLNPVNFSSMNIIEQSTAKETLAEEHIARIFYDKYFTLGFWQQPRRGFTTSTHFDFGQKMNAIFKLSKSIYTIDSVGEKETISLLEKEIDVYNVCLRGVWIDTLQFGSPFNARIDSAVIDEIGKSKPNVFLNGIMMEIRDSKSSLGKTYEKIMTVCASHNFSFFDIIQLGMGMLCYRICREKNTVSFLSPYDAFKNHIEIICKEWSAELKLESDLSANLSNTFELALESLFPVIVSDKSSIFYTNPLIIGFLKKWNLLMTDSTEQKKILLLLLPILESVSKLEWSKTISIKKDDKFLELFRIVNNDDRLVSSVVRLVYEINRSNLIRKTYQTEFIPN